jgi:hypothetical protein
MIKLARVAVLGSLVVAPGIASADDVGYQLETQVASTYVSRGIVQYASRTEPSSQTTASVRVDNVGRGSLAFTAWNAVALNDYEDQPGNSLELDLSVAYAVPLRSLTLTTGYTVALFPHHVDGTPVDGTHELAAMVSYDNPYVVPSVAANVEVAHQQGIYLVAGATRDLHVDQWTFSPAVSVGGATYRKYQGGDVSAPPHLNDVTATAGVKHDFEGGVYATARVSYAFCGTPAELMPMDADWQLGGRSTLIGTLAVGVAH